MFKCDGCGCCCENLQQNNMMQDMHSGDGVCYFFNKISRQCNIYEFRPLVCRVDDYYHLKLATFMSKQEYYQNNSAFCEMIKKQTR
ncbi:MAG: YkgJ family cysteine cluster protein [Aeromonas sp.]